MKKMALTILLLGLNFAAYADIPSSSTTSGNKHSHHRYQVEVIFFQHRNPENLTQETWPSYPALPETSNAIELQPSDENASTMDYQLLPSRFWHMRDESSRIRNSGQYKLLGHLAWQQTIPGAHLSRPIHIHVQDNTEGGEWNLDGTLSFGRTNYVIVNANLLLSLPRDAVNFPEANQTNLSQHGNPNLSLLLKQQHRMRTHELYYFDQPLFGMLVKVVPVG